MYKMYCASVSSVHREWGGMCTVLAASGPMGMEEEVTDVLPHCMYLWPSVRACVHVCTYVCTVGVCDWALGLVHVCLHVWVRMCCVYLYLSVYVFTHHVSACRWVWRLSLGSWRIGCVGTWQGWGCKCSLGSVSDAAVLVGLWSTPVKGGMGRGQGVEREERGRNDLGEAGMLWSRHG